MYSAPSGVEYCTHSLGWATTAWPAATFDVPHSPPWGLAVTALGSVTLARLHGRVEGWRASMVVLAAFVLYAVAQHHG